LLADSSSDVTLIEGSGGAFEITQNKKLVFSKKSLGRFPTDEELDALLN